MTPTTSNKETSSAILKLTPSNYYSAVADEEFWSFSVFKQFMQCEAKAMYKLQNHEEPEHPPMPLLVGNYVHSYFESTTAHNVFIEKEHDNLYQRSGKKLLADVIKAEQMIDVLDSDQFFTNAYQGDKEAIVTGELFGQPWRGKIDCLNLDDGYFIDLKTTADMYRTFWNPRYGGRTLWLLHYGYVMQLAIYQQLIYQTYGKLLKPFIFAVSKQDPPDHMAFKFRQDQLQFELDTVERLLPTFQRIKVGELQPNRCERCDYCKATKQLSGFVETDDLMID